ncbi:MAG: DUF4250 domain-containing protein [Eubacteriales bacterium]|nr:DUF4250 domain-containing protein [Eubacteriales bacterium]
MIPQDPIILLSYINTKLRDHYTSLDQLCRELDVNQAELERKLGTVDYTYDRAKNQFI